MNNPQPSNDRVLLVDDDPVARLLTSSALSQHGFAVVEAASGAEAIERFSTATDCVLLDAMMPGMDGFATCAALRRLAGGTHVPILMLTGLDDEESVSHAYEAGATDFFVKSTQWMLLAQRTRYLLRAARTRHELERNRAMLARAQRIARLGVWQWDHVSDQVTCSDVCFALLGVANPGGPFPMKLFEAVIHDEDLPRLREELACLVHKGGNPDLDIRTSTSEGRVIYLHVEAEAELDAAGNITNITGTLQDVTLAREAEQHIRALAEFDSLTGLPNRRVFRERFGSAIELARRHKRQLGALFLDLDRFKQINDTQGHGAGDVVLREVAARLNRCVRAGEGEADVVARLGGDEFAVLLTDIADAQDVERVAERILQVMRKPFLVNGRENFISASVGIARYPENGSDVESLLRNADAAMYSVKGNGRNAIAAYRPEFNLVDRKRWELEQALHKALERDELVLHYQPQIDVRTGGVPGVEALMRWNHAGRLVPPGDFIPIAEETGLIVPFGEWALATAAEQAAKWIRDGLDPVRIAVNIPGSHFQRPGFVDVVRNILEHAGLPGHLLELEITETMLMNDISATLGTLKQLNDLDVRLSIDDFGTGYSSLSYLKRFDIDQLKIDRSFVNDIKPDSENETITAAIIAMATALKLEVVAEGVETREQMQLLQKRGCQLMQGYYFSRPLPLEAVTTLLAELQLNGPREEWKLGDLGRVVAQLPALRLVGAAA
jgi:diguanylate cyclase (GGDEF)-like protein